LEDLKFTVLVKDEIGNVDDVNTEVSKLLGDVNISGGVTTGDISVLWKCLDYDASTPCYLDSLTNIGTILGDVNISGGVTTGDISVLWKCLDYDASTPCYLEQ